MKITDGKGVDYAIESAGRRETMETAYQSVRNDGGKCIIAGNLPLGEKISIDPMELIKGKQIIGTWGGETNPDVDIPKYVNWYLEKKLNLSALIAEKYSLNNINQAFDKFNAGSIGRTLLSLTLM